MKNSTGPYTRNWEMKTAETGLALSAKFARAADQPGEQRGFREITEIELARPRPVLRLVEDEIGNGKGVCYQP
jgi:hypothetical protein